MARLKYIIIIPEGCADHPLEELSGQTPLAAADTPALDELALSGRLGTALMTPNGLDCTDDVTLMSLLGYDPRDHPVGFAAIEAQGMDIDIPEDSWALRLSFINAEDETLRDLAPGSMSRAELTHLLNDLSEALRTEMPAVADSWHLHPGDQHRALLVDHSNRSYSQTIAHPPALLMNEPLEHYRPSGEHGELLRKLIHTSRELLIDHELNQIRSELGEPLITCAWPWGAGGPGGRWLRGVFRPFEADYDGMRGVMLCETDLAAGLASLLRWHVHRRPTGALPHEIAEHAIRALDEYDVICIHLTAIDSAAHLGDVNAQMEQLALMDRHLLAPLVEAVAAYNPWRILLLPSHITRTGDGKHDHAPVPLLIAGEMVTSVVKGVYNEEEAEAADLHIPVGSELMEYFLFGAGIGRQSCNQE